MDALQSYGDANLHNSEPDLSSPVRALPVKSAALNIDSLTVAGQDCMPFDRLWSSHAYNKYDLGFRNHKLGFAENADTAFFERVQAWFEFESENNYVGDAEDGKKDDMLEENEEGNGGENPATDTYTCLNWKSPWSGKRKWVQGDLTEEQKKYTEDHVMTKKKRSVEGGEREKRAYVYVDKTSFHGKEEKRAQKEWKNSMTAFLESLGRISILPGTISHQGQPVILSPESSSSGQSSVELALLADTPTVVKKADAYAEAMKNHNSAKEQGRSSKLAADLTCAFQRLELDPSPAGPVTMCRIWDLISEFTLASSDVSKRMSLMIGARKHLELVYRKHVTEAAPLGEEVQALRKIHAFLRVLLTNSEVNFDAGDAIWKQIYFCMRTGQYDTALEVAKKFHVSEKFSYLLHEYLQFPGRMVSAETAAFASDECERMLKTEHYDQEKLVLHAIISGSRELIIRLLREHTIFDDKIEDLSWFMLCAVRESSFCSSSDVLNTEVSYCRLEDFQAFVSRIDPSRHTECTQNPLVYPYVLLLSIQLLPGVLHLWKNTRDDQCSVDLVHMLILLGNYGFLSEGSGLKTNFGVTDALCDASRIIKQYGEVYLWHSNLLMALEYYAQAAVVVNGGELPWFEDVLDQGMNSFMDFLTEILVHDDGINLLLGPSGAGEEGLLKRFLKDGESRKLYLDDAVIYCERNGLYDKSIEIQKRRGAFLDALDTINKCLSEVVCATTDGPLDLQRIEGLLQTHETLLKELNSKGEISSQEEASLESKIKTFECILWVVRVKLQVAKNNWPAALELTAEYPPSFKDLKMPPHVEACIPTIVKTTHIILLKANNRCGPFSHDLFSKAAEFATNNSDSEVDDWFYSILVRPRPL